MGVVANARWYVHVCDVDKMFVAKVEFGELKLDVGMSMGCRFGHVGEGDVVFHVRDETASFVSASVLSVWCVVGDVWRSGFPWKGQDSLLKE